MGALRSDSENLDIVCEGGCGLKVIDYRDDILTEYRGYLKLKRGTTLCFGSLALRCEHA